MLTFSAGMTRAVNSKRAIAECLDIALGEGPERPASLLILHASLGHDLGDLAAEALRLAPGSTVVGASCCGVVGAEGVSESMKALGIMSVRGEPGEWSMASLADVRGTNAYAAAAQMAREIKRQSPGVSMVFLMASGIDFAADQLIKGIESELGPEVTIFGATSSDNMKGVTSFQYAAGQTTEHGAWLVGFADPTLEVVTQANHGFMAVGTPMIATRTEENRILELNGRPAWTEFTDRLGLPADATPGDSIPIGALGEQLAPALAAEYGNPHLLRVVTKRGADGSMYYATHCPSGTKLWLTRRDEPAIFESLGQMMKQIVAKLGDRRPVAVFHADCLARGRFLFNRVLKEEIVSAMQTPLFAHGEIPWLGMYGFGEFARLGGRNEFHNYTTALAVIARR